MSDAVRGISGPRGDLGIGGGEVGRILVAPVVVLAYLIAFARVLWTAQPPSSDFLGFWSAARLALAHGAAAAYDPAAMIQAQGLGDRFFVFLYPPPFLGLVLPFGWLPYRLALAAWMALGLTAWLAVARRLLASAGWAIAAFPAVFVGAGVGQSGALMGALFVAAALAIETRPFLAGLLLGGLVCKPQLALLVPLALAAGRQRRVFAGAAASALCLLAAALALFGPGAYAGFLAEGPLGLAVLNDPDLWPKMVGLYPSLRLLGVGAGAAAALQLALSMLCAVAVWRSWRAPGEPRAKLAVLALAGALATPYAFTYDLTALIVPLCWLAGGGLGAGFRPGEKAAMAGVYLLPLLTPGLATATRLNLAWLLLAALLWVVWRRGAFAGQAAPPSPA